MTKKQRENHIYSLLNVVLNNGFVTDRWGNHVKKQGDNIFRFKFMKNNLRFEVKKDVPKSTWFNILSKPLIRITEEELNERIQRRVK